MRVGILTGGGDCPGLNPALRACVIRLLDLGHEVVGLRLGWKGLVEGITCSLALGDLDEIIKEGGTMLGSSRTNPFRDPALLEKALNNWKALGLDALVALGGEDTLGVASKLYKIGQKTVGIPKTMDNDLNETDYTFGFDSAVGVATDALDRLRDTARSHERVIVLEVMGRHAGWVALYTAIAGGADWVLLPEVALDLDEMCDHIRRVRERGKKYALVVVSEGIDLPQADQTEATTDAFGHVILSQRGVGEFIANEIEERVGWETRHAVLGHVQRGGAPSVFDRWLASRLGLKAAELVHAGDFGKMASLKGNEIVAVPLEAAVEELKTVPLSLYEEVKQLFR